jgi:hypothetical protein
VCEQWTPAQTSNVLGSLASASSPDDRPSAGAPNWRNPTPVVRSHSADNRANPSLWPFVSNERASADVKGDPMSEQSSDQQLFDGLIATYRELNLKVRPLPEERLSLGGGRKSVRHVILEMRDDELRFSQALKGRLSGTEMIDVFHGRQAGLDVEIPSPDDTTVEVLSQFGTARESTLAMLRGMSPEAWDDPALGALTIRGASDALLKSDATYLERIVGLLGSPSPK